MAKKTVGIILVATADAMAPMYMHRGKLYKRGSQPTLEESMIPQHLYFVLQEKINENDYFLSDFKSYPLQNCEGGVRGYGEPNFDLSDNLKIIASTDTQVELPLIYDYFIKDFVNAGGLWEVTNLLVDTSTNEVVTYKPFKDKRDYVVMFNEDDARREAAENYANTQFDSFQDYDKWLSAKEGFLAGNRFRI